MKTTLDLPDRLAGTVKVRAAEETVKLQEVIPNLLRLGPAAASTETRTVCDLVQFPLVGCARPAKPGEELSPDRVAAILVDGEFSDLGVAALVASAPCQEARGKDTDGVGESQCI